MSKNKVFLTGAAGYVGGSIAAKFLESGYQVTGLVRSQDKVKDLEEQGIIPFMGTLEDYQPLKDAVQDADIIINAADADNVYPVTAILEAIEGSGKTFIHNSGSDVVGDKAAGEYREQIFYEDAFMPPHEKKAGVFVDQLVMGAANRGIHSIVICPGLIYGEGRGIKKDSIQIPEMIQLALKKGLAHHIGKGENVWSTVHIDALAELYMLAVEHAPAGSFYFAGNKEVSFKEIAETINTTFNLGSETKSMTVDEGIQEWGATGAHLVFGSNSRIRSLKAQKILGWKPKGPSVLQDIQSGYYKDHFS
ncbi:NAD-dependent epimerase/dehydratase family protein [Salicibibacter halophilus]|uniref:NAD-dependent epimerase/dehydratase family protein n=1 Tax=Salicibibacter halophilus TaxID=2502791 RepID=A0A514LLF7_9BACI|nr:NAD-dependent epimerase/dehydratase family protein [Salicibibacter halophilus]QDI92688.1 NAD-dependent epimerase/dehydratase family protein [Salicibibacter halophilus]